VLHGVLSIPIMAWDYDMDCWQFSVKECRKITPAIGYSLVLVEVFSIHANYFISTYIHKIFKKNMVQANAMDQDPLS